MTATVRTEGLHEEGKRFPRAGEHSSDLRKRVLWGGRSVEYRYSGGYRRRISLMIPFL